MYIDRLNDIIAHFIGIFDQEVESARMRTKYLEGRTAHDNDQPSQHPDVDNRDFSSDLALSDYDPGLKYKIGRYEYHYSKQVGYRHDRPDDVEVEIGRYRSSNPVDDSHWFGRGDFRQELVIHNGPGSAIAHTLQLNLLQDDDYLDMTAGPFEPRDMSYVTQRLLEFSDKAGAFTPFATFHRTEHYDALQELAGRVHSFVENTSSAEIHVQGTGGQHELMITGQQIGTPTGGTWINGELATKVPDINDFMPERGIAAPKVDPEGQDGPLSEYGASGNSLTVAAGANVVTNVFQMVNTGVISPVTAIMGNYHQIDSITQSWIYSDRDDVDAVFSKGNGFSSEGALSTTVANNIASFARSTYDNPAANDTADEGGKTVFPTAWRVSTIEGDVSFINWVEQYNFITDNDTLKVTSTGSMATVMTGGNAAINLASFLGIGMQYDLVIVGGNVLDMSMISQMAVLYDNDTIRALGGAGNGTIVQSGNNLLWNDASIKNVGANDRFDVMPDYITKTINHINERNGEMPDGMAADPLFAGKQGLNVLYITGNLFDVNYIKQVSVLGDADHVTQAMSTVLKNNEHATVTIDTGSNAVVNTASIIDYDSFGAKTYLAGQLYSDAVLIQGGIIENDTSVSQLMSGKLANEIIAFLHDDDPGMDHSADGVFNGGHDLSWSLAHPADVMQTVVA